MDIVCATNMPFAAEAFGTLGRTTILEGRHLTAERVRNADVLAVRSTCRIDRTLLHGSRVRFVGTATIGTDHLDIPYLDASGIRWCYAPGCNANSVSEYITAALLCLANRHGWVLPGKTVGVIGVGNVGSRVASKAAALGCRVLLNDPPRQRAGETGDFQPLDRLLAESDILTLHVPLTREGPDATYHLVDQTFIDRARPGLILLNASRGSVVETDALINALDRDRIAHAVIDTWEHEPRIHRALLDRVDLGTPHIAGHSYEGKVEGTMMVYREACRFLNQPATWDPAPHLPAPDVPVIDLRTANPRHLTKLLWDAVRAVYDIEADDRRFRTVCAGDEAAAVTGFDDLRKRYPRRREFQFSRVLPPPDAQSATASLQSMGFQVV